MHYYQFNIGDYSSHTRHLSLMEDLAYRRLLELYYLHERPFGDCSIQTARLIGMSEYQQEVETVLTEFFEHVDGHYINPRADEEIAHFHEKIEKASRAGKASAEVRRSKGSTGVKQELNVRSTDVQPTNNHKPRTKNQEPKDIYTPEFEKFWLAYPEKTGKGAAYTSWQKIKPDVQLQSNIMVAVGAYKLSKKVKDGFVKNPATWLNQRCWEDEFAEAEADANKFAGDI